MYLKDPKTGEKSVTLTFLVLSFLLFAGFAGAEALGYTKNGTGSLSELFYACAALYFGRRVKVGSKSFEVGNQDEAN
jgi:hypothetical protein